MEEEVREDLPTAMTQSDIQIIHNLYCRLTGFELRMAMWRERYWYEYLHAGFTEADLVLVIGHLQRGIHSGERRRGCLRFSNLIEQLDHWEEELALARAYARNNRPRTNREAIVQSFRPSHGGQTGEAKAKPVKEVLLKWTEDMRKAVE